ncbi:MAG: ABC transporter ATP-binding protein [Phycisphaerae bacterium]
MTLATRDDVAGRPPASDGPPDSLPLPAGVAGRLDGQLRGANVLAWAEYDLDDDLQYTRRYAVLTAERLLLVLPTEVRAIELPDVKKTEVAEALGVDRLLLLGEERLLAELAFTRSCRKGMLRLWRKLESMLFGDDTDKFTPVDEEELEDEEVEASKKILWRLLDTAKPYRRHVNLALLFTFISSALLVVPAVVPKFLIDRAINPMTTQALTTGERVGNLFFWIGVFAVGIVLMELVMWLRLRSLTILGSRIASDLRHQVYEHLHGLSMRYFGKHRVGSLITRVTSDTDRLWDFIVFGSVDFIRNILMMVVAATVMLVVNWRLGLIALIPVPIVALLVWWKTKAMVRGFSRLWTYWSRLTAVVGDALPGVKVIKAFASEDREIERFQERNRAFTTDEMAVLNVWTGMQPIVEGVMMLSRVFIFLAGGYFIITAPDVPGNTIGTLVMFLSIVHFFHMPIMEIAQKQRLVTRAATSAQRVYEVLDTKPEIDSKPGAFKKEKLEGLVEFRNVAFSYEGTKPALRDVSLRVEPGRMIGLCGHSGAGKSTFVNLLSRFFDVTDGAILVDGVDIRDYDLKWLRGHIGVVLQEPYLFYGTVADNIRYGKPDATDAQVIQAAKAANAHDFVVGLPDGYDTLVGERGQSLSGGERQRVSIARAILHNPKILVLDEATSSVDTETEKQIQQALDRLVAGRTTFAIAHRLSTLQSADELVVLDKGRVAERGTHTELIAKPGGIYAKLQAMQQEMNKLEEVEI